MSGQTVNITQYFSEGCPDAFALLIDSYGPMVYAVCRKTLERAEDAEDATQAVFLALVRKATSLRGREEDLPLWLHRAALYAAREVRRKDRHRRKREEGAALIFKRSSERSASGVDVSSELQAAIDGLPPRLREAIILRYFAGKSPREIAVDLGRPQRTIEQRITTGLTRLRQKLRRRDRIVSAVVLAGLLESQLLDAGAAYPSGLSTSIQAMCMPFQAGTSIGGAGGIAGIKTASVGRAATDEIAALAEGVSRIMFWTKMKASAVAAMAAVLVVGSVATAATMATSPDRERTTRRPKVSAPLVDAGRKTGEAGVSDVGDGEPGKPVDGLQLRLALDKKSYVSGEPVVVTATFHNKTKSSFYLGQFSRLWWVDLKAKSRRFRLRTPDMIRALAKSSGPKPSDYTFLKADQSFQMTWEVSPIRLAEWTARELAEGDDLLVRSRAEKLALKPERPITTLPPGEYSLRVRYGNQSGRPKGAGGNPGARTWKGKLWSDTVRLTVAKRTPTVKGISMVLGISRKEELKPDGTFVVKRGLSGVSARLHLFNDTDKPLNVWGENCSWGANCPRLTFTGDKPIFKAPPGKMPKPMVWWPGLLTWEQNAPVTDTIPPHGFMVRHADLSRLVDHPFGVQSARSAVPMPPRLWSGTFNMMADFIVKPDDQSRRLNVWTGSLRAANTIKVEIVKP